MPHKTKVTLVFGKPIVVSKKEKPSHHDVDRLHGAYMVALTELFDEHKDGLGYGDQTLVIL